MAIENAKTLNVRIKNKYDSYENWAASGLVLEAGEIAIAYTTVDVKVDNGTAKHPALLMKVGDGEKTFESLPWMSAKAADVLAVCKDETQLTAFVNGVIADAGIASSSAMEALAGRVTTAEGAIDALELLVGSTSVQDQIDAKIAALNLADTYAAKSHTHAMTDVTGLVDAVADAKKAGTDAASALDTYKTTNNAAVEKNATDIAAIQTNYATKTEAQGYADAKDSAIAEAKKAGTDAAAALETYKTANDAAVQANAGAITAIKDGASIDSFADVETALAGKQATGDYATKTEAQGYATAAANGKDAAIQAAQDAADAAQGEVDALETLVGALPEGATATTVVGYIEEKTANIASDATVSALADRVEAAEGAIDAIEADYLKAADKTELADAIALKADQTALEAEAQTARAAEKANADAIDAIEKDYLKAADKTELQGNIDAVAGRMTTAEGAIDAIEADYLKAADKTELQGQITTNANAIELLTNGVSADEVDGVNDLIQYVKDHGTEVTGIKADIKANADAIDAIEADYLKAADKTELQEQITANDGDISALQTAVGTKAAQADLEALAGRVTTAEGKVATLEGEMDAVEGRATALEGLVGETSVEAQIEAAIEALKIGDYAKAADLTAAVNRITTAEGKITTLEGKMTTAEGEIDALQTEVAKKANDADLAAIAKSGSTDDLVQGEQVLVFNCGTSAV